MVITYKKANNKFMRLDNKWLGVRYGIYRAVRVRDRIVIMKKSLPILFINKKNEFEYVDTKSLVDLRFFNRYTPIKIKVKNGKWFVGYIPFHSGIRVNLKGDMIIPHVWPSETINCDACRTRYTSKLCTDCYYDQLNGDDQW